MSNEEKWYVLQTRTGHEDKIREICDIRLEKRGVSRIFVPKIELKKKYRGQWQMIKRPMYPGYIFLSVFDERNADGTGKEEGGSEASGAVMGSKALDSLFLELKKIPYLTRILNADGIAVPVSEEDKKRVESFIGEGETAELSVGIIEGDEVKIFEGSLKDHEALIKKIDRHKRTALVETEFMGEKRLIEVGLEIILKNK